MAVTLSRAPRRLTDDQLLSEDFRYSDPESIAGLNQGVPDPTAHPTIVGYYDVTPAGGKRVNPNGPFIRCCHCGMSRHWQGRVIRDDQGQVYIIGASKCGKDHYGALYVDAETSFKAERSRQSTLLRWRNMLSRVAGLRAAVTEILSSEGVKALELKRAEIRRASPEGFKKLVQFAMTKSRMVQYLEFRDHAAERQREAKFEKAMAQFNALPSEERRWRRDEGLKPQEDQSPIFRRTSEDLGFLAGGDFLTERGDVRKIALDLRKALDAIDGLALMGTDSAKTSDLSRLTKHTLDCIQILEQTLNDLSFSELFFKNDNLERITQWSSGESAFRYGFDESDLIITDSSGKRSRINPNIPEYLEIPKGIEGSKYWDDGFLPMMAAVA